MLKVVKVKFAHFEYSSPYAQDRLVFSGVFRSIKDAANKVLRMRGDHARFKGIEDSYWQARSDASSIVVSTITPTGDEGFFDLDWVWVFLEQSHHSWVHLYEETLEKERLEKARIELEKRAAQIEAHEKRERETYERLKRKFEPQTEKED